MVDEVLAAAAAGPVTGAIEGNGGEGWVLRLTWAAGTADLNGAVTRRLREALTQRVDEARRTGAEIPAGLAQLDRQLPEWDRLLAAKRQVRAPCHRPMNKVIAAAFA